MKISGLLSGLILLPAACLSQVTYPVNGVVDNKHITYAFTHAHIFTDYKTVVDDATLIIKDGVVKEVGKGINIPANAVVYNMKGKFIYPSFVEPFGDYGVPEARSGAGNREWPQFLTNTKGAYSWNQAVKPEFNSFEVFSADSKKAEELRKMGYGAVNSFRKDGIVRGTSVVVTLADEREHKTVLKEKASLQLSFDKGNSTQDYPSSLMGAIALLRQTYYDAQWYENSGSKLEYNISLEAMAASKGLPQVIESTDKYTSLRADKVGDEFKIQYVIKGSGDEYQRLQEIKNTSATFILPLNFPLAYDTEDPYDAANVSLAQLKHWESAPSNPSVLEKASVPFAFTSSDLKDRKDFLKNIRKAIEYGLTEQQALRALTLTPAEIYKVSDKVGALKTNMQANFIITSGNIFEKESAIYENWVQGNRYIINDVENTELRGTYQLTVGGNQYNLNVAGEANSISANLKDGDKSKISLSFAGDLISFQIEEKKNDPKGVIRFTGTADTAVWKGSAQMPDGEWVSWTAKRTSRSFDQASKKDTAKKPVLVAGSVFYPDMEYGWEQLPTQKDVLIKGVTVWTNEKEGILKNQDVLIQNGKVAAIAPSINSDKLKLNNVETIDGTNKHLSCGIIDEHSHIAISRGVNEGTQAVTSEVRIGDVIDGDDIDVYRQLSGGVTTSQLLHGSANPIGGQAATIKLRWGQAPEKMKFEGSDGFIKFALGENVKQSNWGDKQVLRFPQTRMGVEQVYMDAFTRAKEYEKALKNASSKGGSTASIRKDLELDALVEILNKKRFITCHSYVQSEINMLMHVSDSMGFKVNTFTHILEGYKVADKMKKYGVGGSTFADWWAYKYEVIDAIPYNAALMTKEGIVTAINSDDAEMGRRLNQEAAKSVKYGGLTEEEAFKMCTLNPAKLLHIDNRVGSVKVGKDADLVLWSDNPLSIYSRVEKTFVDGICYFDAEKDIKLRERNKKERARIIKLMAEAKKKGDSTQKPIRSYGGQFHCEQ